MPKNCMVDIVPAILSYSKQDMLNKLSRVGGIAPAIHIDIMDGHFVKNKTIGPAELADLPYHKIIEYHLMVSDPARYMHELPGGSNVIYQAHIEATAEGRAGNLAPGGNLPGVAAGISHLAAIAAHKNSKFCIAINPSTPLETVGAGIKSLRHVLIMAVVPGIDGQKYMAEVETKISQLRNMMPDIIIEVDGGINMENGKSAVRAGANRLAAATAIFAQPDAVVAYKQLHLMANEG